MIIARQGQTLYCIPPEQFDPMPWQVAVTPLGSQIQLQQPTLVERAAEALGKVVVVGGVFALTYAVCELLFGQEARVMHCSECGREGHTVRSCPFTGPRTRLRIEKTGNCQCCGGRFRSTELHHYAGRGEYKGKEMCGPCHFHCGHRGDWYNFPINPRYCRVAG